MSAQRAKGTAFETLITRYLHDRLGDDRIMRMPLTGAHDRGDVAGIRTLLGEKIAVEVKNHARLNLAGWIEEARVEKGNADAAVGVVVHKRTGRGIAMAQYVTMTLGDFAILLGADREWED